MDVKNASLQGDLEETVYMHQPPGFVDERYPNHVCKLSKAIYGLQQAPRAWNLRFAKFITNLGSLFVYRNGNDLAYILLYVDYILLTASSHALKDQIIMRFQCRTWGKYIIFSA